MENQHYHQLFLQFIPKAIFFSLNFKKINSIKLILFLNYDL
jgi:hypothetical protein